MKKNDHSETQVVSFRLSNALIKKINSFAKEKCDETGKSLSTSKAARMLLFKALEIESSLNIVNRRKKDNIKE